MQRDPQPAAFQQAADGGRGQALTERRDDAACHKDVLCRHSNLCDVGDLVCSAGLAPGFGLFRRLQKGCTINYGRNCPLRQVGKLQKCGSERVIDRKIPGYMYGGYEYTAAPILGGGTNVLAASSVGGCSRIPSIACFINRFQRKEPLPSGAKARILNGSDGMAEAMPLQRTIY